VFTYLHNSNGLARFLQSATVKKLPDVGSQFRSSRHRRKGRAAMQLIEYQCRKCRYVFAKIHFQKDSKAVSCPRCHHHVVRQRLDFTAPWHDPPPATPFPDTSDEPTWRP